jgi:hypothetical protein
MQSFIADPGWTYSVSQLQERLTERTSGTDRKRRQAPVGPPTRMPGGTKDTVMMTVSIVMPADRVCVRSWLNMSTCGIRERLTPRDTEQTQYLHRVLRGDVRR